MHVCGREAGWIRSSEGSIHCAWREVWTRPVYRHLCLCDKIRWLIIIGFEGIMSTLHDFHQILAFPITIVKSSSRLSAHLTFDS